jgi:hypothetical protein
MKTLNNLYSSLWNCSFSRAGASYEKFKEGATWEG